MGHNLSKSRYMAGTQCEKMLWLECNKKEEKSPWTREEECIFERGHAVGEMAWGLFPGGVLIANGDGYKDRAGAVSETRSAINSGATSIYEAAFFFDNTYVFIDVLHLNPDTGRWDIYEVKSTGSVKPEQIPDASIQAMALDSSGYQVGDVFITYIKGSQGMCKTDPWNHFGFEPVDWRGESGEIRSNLPRFNRLIEDRDEPEMGMGKQCRKPHECKFQEYCTRIAADGE